MDECVCDHLIVENAHSRIVDRPNIFMLCHPALSCTVWQSTSRLSALWRTIIADLDESRATHGRARGFINEWNPHDTTLALLTLIKLILSQYAAHLPLTCRPIFYRLVGKHGYPKSEKAYASLCQHLNNARQARYINFDAIRDDGFPRSGALGYLNVEEFSRIWVACAERS
jgi:hypothetical protein